MTGSQTVIIGESLFVGGSNTDSREDDYVVFKYDPAEDVWSSLPPCIVKGFGMAERGGKLIAVGGVGRWGISNKVYEFDSKIQRWVESGPTMPTARFWLSVFASDAVIIACGGATGFEEDRDPIPCTCVEVFLSGAVKWCSVDPLPLPCYNMSAVVIHGELYLLGGLGASHMPTRPVLHAPIESLIEKATAKSSSTEVSPDSQEEVWNTFSEPPLRASAAVSLRGSLVAVAGYSQSTFSPKLYGFVDSTDSWVQVMEDLPVSRFFCAAVELPSKKILVIGGKDSMKKRTCTVFVGSVSRH